jgi:putative transposase
LRPSSSSSSEFACHRAPSRYLPSRPPRGTTGIQTWRTFIRNHAPTVLACELFVVVTATFRMLYVFVVLEVGTRRILHWNVTAHPTAEWTAQQFRLMIPGDQVHRFVILDRDTIYSEGVDRTLTAMGLTVLKTPVRAPTANAFCERLVGTMRRECLDFVIPLNERQLHCVLREWVAHDNRGRPHASLGPGIPDRPSEQHPEQTDRHRFPVDRRVSSTAILGGLHHEYRLERVP